ncbi:MAG: GNAT family N-acetyltransferase [Halioglobus sp.]|nr:GNAT family N-acetyltransferase [Halioglobus sp.]
MAQQAGNIRIARFHPLRDEVSESLRDAFANLEHSNPQFSLAWLCTIASHALDAGEEPVIFTAENDSGGLAALPLKISTSGEAQALVNFYTSLYQPVADEAQALPLYTAIFRHLRQAEGLHTVLLAPLDGSTALFPLLGQALTAAGWSGVHDYFCFGNWYYHTRSPSWEGYRESRPSRLKNTIARKTRSFLRDDRGRLEIISDGDRLDQGIDDYNAIYHSSWKRNEPYPGFIPALVSLAADKGWLRLGLAYYDEVAVASQIWLVADGTAYIFKLAYHPDYAGMSPGTVLTAHLARSVLEEDRVHTIDYLSGDDTYKRDWMSERRERYGIAAFNARTPTGSCKLVREWLRRLLRGGRESAAGAD